MAFAGASSVVSTHFTCPASSFRLECVIMLVITGIAYFRKTERTFADII